MVWPLSRSLWISGETWLWPSRNTAVANSIEIPGSTAHRQIFVVGDGLHDGFDPGARGLEQFVIRQRRVALGEFVNQPVVLAREHRVHRQQGLVFAGSDVAGEDTAVGVGRQIALAVDDNLAALDAQARGPRRVRAVNHRSVDESSNGVGKLARVVCIGPRPCKDGPPEERQLDRSRPVGIEVGIAGRHPDVCGLGIALPGQVEIVIEELTPHPHEITRAGRVGLGAFLFDDDIADDTRIGPVGDHFADAVGKTGFRQAQQR
jgi:hypothetical protein